MLTNRRPGGHPLASGRRPARSTAPLLLLLLSACPSPAAPPAPPASAEAPVAEPSVEASAEAAPAPPRCEALPDWRYERIPLPPQFAPTLPAGEEVLWFAPGMFDPQAEDYFTYAFSLKLESALDPATIEPLLLDYYRGLMAAVASGRDAPPAHPAVVTMADDGRRATIELSDEFTDQRVITLHLRLLWPDDPASRCLQVRATAKPTEANESQLDRSSACLCDRAPP